MQLCFTTLRQFVIYDYGCTHIRTITLLWQAPIWLVLHMMILWNVVIIDMENSFYESEQFRKYYLFSNLHVNVFAKGLIAMSLFMHVICTLGF